MLLYILDLFGTAVFAISGVWLACRKDMDLFGAMVLAFVTAVGGGTIRDILLGATPVFWMKDTLYLIVILVSTLLALIVRHWHESSRWIMLTSDALGLAVFAVIGFSKTLSYGGEPIVAIMMGILTGCGGGAIRDVLAGEVPLVLRKEIYAFAAMVGGIIYIVLEPILHNTDLNVVITAIVIFILRMLTVYKDISLPQLNLPQHNRSMI